MIYEMPSQMCTKCYKFKDLSNFSPNRARILGVQSACKECCRATRKEYYDNNRDRICEKQNKYREANPEKVRLSQLAHRYGVTKLPKGKCMICESTIPNGRNFHVDHCKISGKVRGVLCGKCNPGLGYFNHNPKLLRLAAKYLEEA